MQHVNIYKITSHIWPPPLPVASDDFKFPVTYADTFSKVKRAVYGFWILRGSGFLLFSSG